MKKKKFCLIFFPSFFLLFYACWQDEIIDSASSYQISNEESVFVPWDCNGYFVQTWKPIALNYEWKTMTRDQNDAYFDVSDHISKVDAIKNDTLTIV